MRHPRPRRIHLDAANTMQLEWSSGRDRSFARQLLKLILDHWRARKRKEKSKLKCLHLVPDRVSFYASFLLSERCSILRSLRSVSLFIFERTLVKQFPLFFFFFFSLFLFFLFLHCSLMASRSESLLCLVADGITRRLIFQLHYYLFFVLFILICRCIRNLHCI